MERPWQIGSPFADQVSVAQLLPYAACFSWKHLDAASSQPYTRACSQLIVVSIQD